MSERREYSVSEFKAKALGLLMRVSKEQLTLTITKRGKPIAEVIPYAQDLKVPVPGKLAGTVIEEKDIVSPLGPDLWKAAR